MTPSINMPLGAEPHKTILSWENEQPVSPGPLAMVMVTMVMVMVRTPPAQHLQPQKLIDHLLLLTS